MHRSHATCKHIVQKTPWIFWEESSSVAAVARSLTLAELSLKLVKLIVTAKIPQTQAQVLSPNSYWEHFPLWQLFSLLRECKSSIRTDRSVSSSCKNRDAGGEAYLVHAKARDAGGEAYLVNAKARVGGGEAHLLLHVNASFRSLSVPTRQKPNQLNSRYQWVRKRDQPYADH